MNKKTLRVSPKSIERLGVYRRVLQQERAKQKTHIFSHQLAMLCGNNAAQTRRDLMAVGYEGSPSRGYDIDALCRAISALIDGEDKCVAVLVGVGNLGAALLEYVEKRCPHLRIGAAFDSDHAKTGRVLCGVRCHSVDEMDEVIKRNGAEVGVIAVPGRAAQEVADMLASSGIKGILNFAPVALRVSKNIYVEQIDLAVALEKVAYFTRRKDYVKKER